MGHHVSHAHKLSKRRFNVNLQRVRVLVNGQVMRMRVSTDAIKSGLITRPPIKLKERKPKAAEIRPGEAAQAEAVTEEPVSRFFSEATVATRLFKPKVAPEEMVKEAAASPVPGEAPDLKPSAPADPQAGESSIAVEDKPQPPEEQLGVHPSESEIE